jgi:hypothetical protein
VSVRRARPPPRNRAKPVSHWDPIRFSRGGSRTRNRLVVILGVVGIALSVVAFLGPWWSVQSTGFSHAGYCNEAANWGPFGFTTTNAMCSNEQSTFNYSQWPHTAFVFLVGSVLSASSLSFGAVFLLSTVLPGGRVWLRKTGSLWGAAAGIASLIAAVYLAASLPGAVTDDTPQGLRLITFSGFWGSGSGGMMDMDVSATWGAGWAWYAVVIAAVLFLVAAVLLFRARPTSAPQTTVPTHPPSA